MKKYLTLVFVMIFALVLVGCGGGEKPTPDSGNELKSIAVRGKSELTVGETTTYTAKINPANATNAEYTWSTSDETVLTINEKGEATAKAETDRVLVYATSTKNPKIKGQKSVYIVPKGGESGSYPDLNGYVIKIAQAQQALGNFDPFLAEYTQLNKEAKQQAWTEVQDDFNCKIEVVAYPATAEWGPSRWNYIKAQAAEGVADYDFYTVPDSTIAEFVEAGALIDLTEAYTLYGNEMMDPSFITSGSYKNKLYGLTEGQNNIYNVMYYNIGLLKELQAQDPTLKEPAQLFLDGEWNYTRFVNYCLQVQNTMADKYADAGKANSEAQEYFAVSGWDAYWYVGLSSNDGDPIANTDTYKINLESQHRLDAAEVVKEIYTKGYAAKAQNVDQSVTQWNEGKALFNTGDLWFVGAENRWPANLWGEGTTEYGYVPWPMPDDMTLADYKIALGGTAQWVMPIGRDYSAYGADCTPNNIYRAVAEMLQRTDKYYKESAAYDEELAMKTIAARYAQSDASQQAYIQIQKYIEEGRGYFDPMMTSDNPVGSLYANSSSSGVPLTMKAAVSAYCVNGTIDSWSGAISTLVKNLEESLVKAFS